MNNNYIIAGSVAVVSLAAGGAGGYLIAKKRFEQELQTSVKREVGAAEKYFELQLGQLRAEFLEEKDPPLVIEEDPELPSSDALQGEEFDLDQAPVASTALRNYQGYSNGKIVTEEKPPLSSVVANNIFSDAAPPKKSVPVRDTVTGKFVPRQTEEIVQIVPEDRDPEGPYLIDGDVFLANDPEFDQESLLYFVKAETLIMLADNESVENDRVGEDNLLKFPPNEIGKPSVIYVRNEEHEIDYQVTLTRDSLTEYMGLGEDDDDLVDELADQD